MDHCPYVLPRLHQWQALLLCPSPAANDQISVACFDIGYSLEVGNNVIAVVAHNINVPRSNNATHSSGLWCQLDIEDSPVVWTEENWLGRVADCYQKNQPRVSRTSGFIESVDLRLYPHDWMGVEFDDSGWNAVERSDAVDIENEPFISAPDFEPTSEKFPFDNLIFRGQVAHDKITTHVYFPGAVKNARGLFVAETFVNAESGIDDILLYLFCDDPYYFYVNDDLVKKQGGRKHEDWSAPSWNMPRCYQQDAVIDVAAEFSLKEGWNRLLFFQMVGKSSSGATFVLPEIQEGEFKFVKATNSFGLPGWNVAGPLKLPFSHVENSISMSNFKPVSYYAIHPCDEAAHLLSYSYEITEELNEPVDCVELRSNEYAVFDLENYQRGCLDMVMTGNSGDTIDIVYGEYLQDHVAIPFDQGTRRIFPLVLDDGDVRWHSIAPHGMQYVMIVVRNAAETINFQEMGLRKISLSFKNQSSFACSDELLNQIWENGIFTPNASYDHIFLNSSGCREGQLLGDAMIQAMSSFYVFGNGEFSRKALIEFASAQFETGEIPSIAPSDLSLRYFDFCLLWPVWLHKHILYTDDKESVQELLPTLNKLLLFFENISDSYSNLIGDASGQSDTPCLIDYDKTIDKKGITTGLNALYCFSLLKCEWIYNYVGDEQQAQNCNKRASRVAQKLRDATWDSKKGLFSDGYCNDEKSSSYSLQANVLALYGGVAEPENYEKIFNNLFFEFAPFQETIKDHQNENAYFKYFIIDMAFTLNLREWALDYMRYYWGKMVQLGATTWWDKFSPDVEFGPEKAQSICHGYGVSPNLFLIREVAGIRVCDPGFKRIYFSPMLAACEWVRATTQTPHGGIKVEWSHKETGELEILIESDFPLEVIPQLDPEIATNPIIHINDEVTIIDSDTVQTETE